MTIEQERALERPTQAAREQAIVESQAPRADSAAAQSGRSPRNDQPAERLDLRDRDAEPERDATAAQADPPTGNAIPPETPQQR